MIRPNLIFDTLTHTSGRHGTRSMALQVTRWLLIFQSCIQAVLCKVPTPVYYVHLAFEDLSCKECAQFPNISNTWRGELNMVPNPETHRVEAWRHV
jgi:recombinational DNA repair protein (RecF pathway)